MKKSSSNYSLVFISVLTALTVGLINSASAFIAYSSFIPKKTNTTVGGFISDSPSGQTITVSTGSGSVSQVANQPSATTTSSSSSQSTSSTTASTTPATTSRYCSGVNPNLEDGVCEAIISIANDPSANNPHLSAKAKQSLSLMPTVKSLSMDESSWKATSATSGTMNVIADTEQYGKVKLKITLDKINGIWILTDGQLA